MKRPDFNGAEFYFIKGNDKTILKDYNGAIHDYTKAISLNDDFPCAFFHRGMSGATMIPHPGP